MLLMALHSVICYPLPYGVFFATSGANASNKFVLMSFYELEHGEDYVPYIVKVLDFLVSLCVKTLALKMLDNVAWFNK